MNNACVFCDRANLEERLIYENEDFYVAATLGQITDGGYVLIIPKKHIQCIGELSSRFRGSYVFGNQAEEIFILTNRVCRAISSEYKKGKSVAQYAVTTFEHGIVGQTIKHAHLHILPLPFDLTPRIQADFPNSRTEVLISGQISHLQALYCIYRKPYLFWSTPTGDKMVCWNPPAPAQYLRLVAAELLGRPERGNWRDINPEQDKVFWQETVHRLKPYFS